MILPENETHALNFKHRSAREVVVNYIQANFDEFVPANDRGLTSDSSLDLIQARVREMLRQRLPLLDHAIAEVRDARIEIGRPRDLDLAA